MRLLTIGIKIMKKLFILLSLFCLVSCFNTEENESVGSSGNTSSTGEASYNVNIYDDKGDWYETGLLIESFDNRVFVKIDDGRYELITSDKEDYRYMIETEEDEVLYVK